MCGVAGVLSFRGEPPLPKTLLAMARSLAHRGPDGGGVELLGPCGLAHRRLSIIDLSPAGRQPMSSPDRRLWLSYNGEVYNYLELRAELEKRGASFHTGTDSEVILHAYREWGLGAFERFNGMWGLALWDSAAQELLLSRDRFGVKPMLFHRDARRLIFASEAKALLAAEPDLAEPDLSSVAEFIERPLVSVGRSTIFRGIERVGPGTVLVVSAGGRTREHRFWTFRPPREPLAVSDSTAADRVAEILTDSVRLRFRSDVPVGTCLSGGIDSSSIVALSAKRLGKAPECFSALYSAPGFDEGEFVRLMTKDLGLETREIWPDGSDLPEVFERMAYHQEEPSAGPGLYSQWHVMRVASPRVRVLLDGQGGDEVFAGYLYYFDAFVRALLPRAARLDLPALAALARTRSEAAPILGRDPIAGHLAGTARAAARRAARMLARSLAATGPAGERAANLGRDLRRRLARGRNPAAGRSLSAVRELVRPDFAERARIERVTGNALTDLLWDQLVRTSIPGLLHYEDRNSMAFSIEARVPFLDYRLVEYAFSLPMELKIRGGWTKHVLREAMRGVLPEPVRTRRDKKGYPTPLVGWLREKRHEEWARDLLLSDRVRARKLLDVAAVEALWREHQAGTDHAWRIWQLMSLELFFRRFVDRPFAAEPPPVNCAE